MVPSSSGLGRCPLKAATRVRISLGSPIQTAVMKMAAFSFISKAFSKFGCLIFKNSHFFNLSELFYNDIFFNILIKLELAQVLGENRA